MSTHLLGFMLLHAVMHIPDAAWIWCFTFVFVFVLSPFGLCDLISFIQDMCMHVHVYTI